MPLHRFLANPKREFSERKWTEARCPPLGGGRLTAKKDRMPDKQPLKNTVANISKFEEANWQILPSEGGTLTPPNNTPSGQRTRPPPSVGGVRTGPGRGHACSTTTRAGNGSRRSCGRRCGKRREGEGLC